MMNRFNLIKIFGLLFLGILFISCSKNSKNETSDSKLEVMRKSNPSSNNSGNAFANNEGSYGQVQPTLKLDGPVIDSKLLLKYLPDRIPGSQKQTPSNGTIKNDNGIVSSATSVYKFQNGGVSISLQDYGNINNISKEDQKYFNNPPSVPGLTNERISNSNGIGYVNWDETANSGKLYFLFGNRFVITLEAYKLPAEMGGMQNVLNFMKLDRLANDVGKK
jgi:hypothetical protein